jgi:hypothetical protein
MLQATPILQFLAKRFQVTSTQFNFKMELFGSISGSYQDNAEDMLCSHIVVDEPEQSIHISILADFHTQKSWGSESIKQNEPKIC